MSFALSRRNLLHSMFGSLGCLGVANVLARDAAPAAAAGSYSGPRFPARAKHVINLVLSGGPSQVDLFDPKPALAKYEGQRPGSVELRTERQTGGLLPTPFEFRPRGQSGIEVSGIIPNLACASD